MNAGPPYLEAAGKDTYAPSVEDATRTREAVSGALVLSTSEIRYQQ